MTDLQQQQIAAREPEWRGRRLKRFRWSRFRFEWGRWCYVVSTVEGCPDYVWWEWSDK